MRLCVIPARGGSKRIPRKNIKEFCGKPMISWSIDAALQSGCFDRIVVSTDDVEIAELAAKCGAEVPFFRPEELSDDYTGTKAVIAHVIKRLKLGESDAPVCCIYATAPFIQPADIRSGLDKLISSSAKFSFAVTSYPFPIQRAIRLTKGNRVEMFNPDCFNTRSQDLDDAWHDAGQFYWGTVSAWLDESPIFSTHSTAIVLPRYRVQDIDTAEDWRQAELLFSALKANNN
jgi:pseudaminic acid cytidylyltransferase